MPICSICTTKSDASASKGAEQAQKKSKAADAESAKKSTTCSSNALRITALIVAVLLAGGGCLGHFVFHAGDVVNMSLWAQPC